MGKTYDPDVILADPNSLHIHRIYARINIGIRDRGEHWDKCANCGMPYQLTEEWNANRICSPVCEEEYREYLGGF